MNIITYILICLLANFLLATHAVAQRTTTFTVMEYNCENVFDTIHDAGKNDYDFVPDGARHWRRWKLADKLKGIAKVIMAANEHRPADIIGLCEVENDTVMTMLTQHSPLAAIGYKYVMTHSADSRGIDVALLYSPYTFHPFATRSISLPPITASSTRDILHVSGTIAGGDTLDIFLAHLPSKLGGNAAFHLSMDVARLLQHSVDSILQHRSKPNIIAMGDFNANNQSPQLRLLTRNTPLSNITKRVKPGTYKYQGHWTTIDHILAHTTTLRHTSSRALILPALLEDDKTHGGKRPRRTYLGTIYHGGLSDHLPLVSHFQFR